MSAWGYSGRVGEWHTVVPGGSGDNPEVRFARLVDVLVSIMPSVSTLHQLHKAEIDISTLNDRLEEVEFHEFVPLKAATLEDVIPALKHQVAGCQPRLITRVLLELDTWIIEDDERRLIPESADLYLGTDPDIVPEDVSIYLSYSTYIDIWLPETFGPNRERRDNSTSAKLNHHHLQNFLQSVSSKLGSEFEAGESVHYARNLRETGFA